MSYKQKRRDAFAKVNHDGTITIPKKYVDMLGLTRHSVLTIHADRQNNVLQVCCKIK